MIKMGFSPFSVSSTGGGIPSFGSSFAYSDYGIQGQAGQVVNAVVDQTGTVLNYSTNTAQPGHIVQQRTIVGGIAGQVQGKLSLKLLDKWTS